MGRPKFFGQEEVDIRLCRERGSSPRRLVPWWVCALRRVSIRWGMRRQRRGSLSSRSLRPRFTGLHSSWRRSVVKASFSRNRKKGAWATHARYLSRPGAQRAIGRGLGFDAERENIDMVARVRAWAKGDELMWRFIVSPEDADRMNLRTHVRELVSEMERDLETKLQWVAVDLRRVNHFCLRIDSRFLLPSRGYLPHVNCYPAAERLRGGGGDGEATEHGDTARA